MNCQKAGDLLSAYIEGEVAGRQCADLEAHLCGCGDCREELETLRSALVLLAAPKTLVRPEGLLEEFKAKYLPEAETAAAPRWGFRVPVLLKIEWPSLSRLMLPMGSMAAAGAAAALIVALHGHSMTGPAAPAGPSPSHTQLAANAVPDKTLSAAEEQNSSSAAPTAKAALRTATPMKATELLEVKTVRPRRHEASPPASLAVRHRRLSEPESGFSPEHRTIRHRMKRPRGTILAKLGPGASPVPVEMINTAVGRHRDAVPSNEMLWQAWKDQGGAVVHKATAPVAEDGYAEASCKNLATGKVLRSEAFTIPSEPTPAGPVDDRSSGGR